MSFLRNMAVALVQRAGYSVPVDPNQVANTNGIKASGFQQWLAQSQQGITMPTPPTPPKSANSPEQQKTYNQALLQYNQQFQTYQTQMMRQFFQRFLFLQQAMIQNRQVQQPNSATTNSTLQSGIGGVGGILDSDSSSSDS